MNKLFNLVKIDILHNFSLNKLSKKHNKKRNLSSLITTIILGVFLFCSVSIVMFSMGVMAKEVGQLDFLLVFGYTIASFLVFTVTISKANSLLFEAKDFELLMSMPINTKIIVFSKLISLLTINYLSFGLITIPCFISYGILSGASLLYYLIAIMTILTGPFLIVTLCSFLSYFIGVILRKVKAKSIITSILSLIIFVIVFVLYMTFVNTMSYMEDPNVDMEYFREYFSNMKNNFMTYYPISKFVCEGLQGNVIQYLIYLLLMIVPFTLLIVFVGKNYLKANIRAKITGSSKNYVLKEQKQNSKVVSILKKDFKRFFSSSAQVLNIGIGPIISTVILVVLLINFQKEVDIQNDSFYKTFMPIMVLVSVGFTYGIMPSTSSSISLEGKNFWIIKSSPIKTKDIFISKIIFNVMICFPFIIINTGIISVFLNYNIINQLFIIQLILVFIYSIEGLWINILTPKFDWDNEVKAIKQGTGPLLSMLLGFALGAFLYVPPFVLLIFNMNGILMLLINSIVVLVIMIIILCTHGKNKYEKIQA